MPTSAINRYEPKTARLDPCYNPEDAEEQVVKLVDGVYLKGTVLGEKVGQSDIYTVVVDADGGYWTFTMPTTPVGAGGTSGHIAAALDVGGASAADVEAALEAIPAIGEGNVGVTETINVDDNTYVITLRGQLQDLDLDTPTVDATHLTGGAGTAVLTVTQDGDPGTLGTFGPYDDDATDGTQHARCILRYACTVASGVVTGINEWGAQQVNAVSAFMRGYFRTEELVGLDEGALADLHATITQGTLAKGTVRIG
jgi:hypothetical protein